MRVAAGLPVARSRVIILCDHVASLTDRQETAIRRVLFFGACTATGIGLWAFGRGFGGIGTWAGLGCCMLATIGGIAGGRWGPGPVARGVRAPWLTAWSFLILALAGSLAILAWLQPL